MYQAFLTNRNSLVFPVLCDGHLKIPYRDNIPNTATSSNTDDSTYGLWALNTSFTIEAIVTPYDCMGYSTSSVKTSTKTLPYSTDSGTESHTFLDDYYRGTYSMCIFYSDTAQLYLVNTSSTTTKPAEYKIQFVVTAGGGASTLNSSAVITGVTGYNTLHEALYLISPYHIAASFNATTGSMDIIVNNVIIASQVHSSKSSTNMSFDMSNTDCYIGTNNDTTAIASTRKQFMGELHELCITKGYKDSFSDIHTLVPAYENLLLYLRFEEVDE